MDKICTENCIKIIQIHQNMHSKLFLENNKKKISCSSFIFQPSAAQDALNRLGPACLARTGRTQAATWAWAGKPRRALAPAWASTWPSVSRPFVSIRRPSGCFAWIKNQAAAGALETLAISALPLSLSSLLASSQPQRRRSPPSSRERGKPERALAPSLAPSPARVLPNG